MDKPENKLEALRTLSEKVNPGLLTVPDCDLAEVLKTGLRTHMLHTLDCGADAAFIVACIDYAKVALSNKAMPDKATMTATEANARLLKKIAEWKHHSTMGWNFIVTSLDLDEIANALRDRPTTSDIACEALLNLETVEEELARVKRRLREHIEQGE